MKAHTNEKSSLIFQEMLQLFFCQTKHEAVLENYCDKKFAFKRIAMRTPSEKLKDFEEYLLIFLTQCILVEIILGEKPASVGLYEAWLSTEREKSFVACEVEKLIEFLSEFDNRSMNEAFVKLIYNNLFIFLSFSFRYADS